jgi:hypothetical protein
MLSSAGYPGETPAGHDGLVIRAILFDLDETLFDHRRGVAYAATSWTESVSPGHPLLMETPALWLDLENKHLPAWHAGECSFAEQRRRRLREFCVRIGLPVPPDPDAAYAGTSSRRRSVICRRRPSWGCGRRRSSSSVTTSCSTRSARPGWACTGSGLDRYGGTPAAAPATKIATISSLAELPGVVRAIEVGSVVAAPPWRTARAGQARRVSAAAATKRRAKPRRS